MSPRILCCLFWLMTPWLSVQAQEPSPPLPANLDADPPIQNEQEAVASGAKRDPMKPRRTRIAEQGWRPPGDVARD